MLPDLRTVVLKMWSKDLWGTSEALSEAAPEAKLIYIFYNNSKMLLSTFPLKVSPEYSEVVQWLYGLWRSKRLQKQLEKLSSI